MPTLGDAAAGSRSSPGSGRRSPSRHRAQVVSAIELGRWCVAELIQRTNLDGKAVEALVFGTVVPSVLAPNIAREVALHADAAQGLPGVHREPRVCVGQPGDHRRRRSDRCSATRGRDRRRRGVAVQRADPPLARLLRRAHGAIRAKTLRREDAQRSAASGRAISCRSRRRSPSRPPARRWDSRPRRWRRSTTSPREEQDQFALRSHRLAAAGTEDGRLTAEIAAVVRAAARTTRADVGQRHPHRHLDRAAARRSSRCSIGATAR